MAAAPRAVCCLLLLAVAMGVASAATTPGNTAPDTKLAGSRKLLGGYGFIPQGCNLVVSVSAAETQRDWFGDAPEIRGRVTLSNPNTYGVPLNNIIVQARSSDGQQYATTADCGGGSGVTVPANPIPYQYGTAVCSFRIVLDRRVFGPYAYGSSGRRLQGDSDKGIHVNFFPGAGGSGGDSGVSYFPPSNRASWTVVAIASVSYSGSQCVSAPTPIDTSCWWEWLWNNAEWFKPHRHHHRWGGFGRKLMSLQAGDAAVPAVADAIITATPTGPARQLASADSGCASLVTPTSFIQRDADGSNSVIGRVTIANPGPVPLAITGVKVVVANTIAFRPIIVAAQCGGATAVPPFSSITCSFAEVLPSNGASADPAVWTTAMAQTLVGSGVQCNSGVVPVYRA